MNSRKSLIQIYLILGVSLFITTILSYLTDLSYSYDIPLIFLALMLIITALFEFKEYYNKNLYLTVVTVVLVAMWILSLIQQLSPNVTEIIYYLEIGVITLVTISVLLNSRKWENIKER